MATKKKRPDRLKKRGRKCKKLTEFEKQMILRFYALYSTEAEVARKIGIPQTTLRSRCEKDPEFLERIKAVQGNAIEVLRQSCFHAAVGYTFPSEKIFPPSKREGRRNVLRVPIFEHRPPDTKAIEQMSRWLNAGLHQVSPIEHEIDLESKAKDETHRIEFVEGLPDKANEEKPAQPNEDKKEEIKNESIS